MTVSSQELKDLYRDMVIQRRIEELMIAKTDTWHGAVGEEASHIGAFSALGPDDIAAPHFRGIYGVHYLRGLSLVEVFGEIYGREISQSKGKGMGMVGSLKHGVLPWTTGTLGVLFHTATGAALSVKLRGQDRVVVMSFGDGSSSRGEFHESLNFAAVKKLPIVYVCVNNQWAEFTPAGKGVAVEDVADRAAGYGIPGAVVDGNDVLAVQEAVKAAMARARVGEGPSLVECKTYRMGGHVAGDRTLYMPEEEREIWRQRDPINRLRTFLVEEKVLTDQEARDLAEETSAEVEKSLEEAAQGARPSRELEFALSEMFAPTAGEEAV